MMTPRIPNKIDEMINTSSGGRAPCSAISPYTNHYNTTCRFEWHLDTIVIPLYLRCLPGYYLLFINFSRSVEAIIVTNCYFTKVNISVVCSCHEASHAIELCAGDHT